MHTTVRATVTMAPPASAAQARTYQELVELVSHAEQRAYNTWRAEHPDVAPESGSLTEILRHRSPELRYLSAVFSAVASPGQWKAPFIAINPQIPTIWIQAAVAYYHGAQAEVTPSGAIVYSPGYQCW